MAHFPDRHIPYYVSTFGRDCIAFDVSNCRETSIARIEAALRRHGTPNTVTIETITRNRKSIIIRHPNTPSSTIHIFRKDGYGKMTLPEGSTCVDFINTYLALDIQDISDLAMTEVS